MTGGDEMQRALKNEFENTGGSQRRQQPGGGGEATCVYMHSDSVRVMRRQQVNKIHMHEIDVAPFTSNIRRQLFKSADS